MLMYSNDEMKWMLEGDVEWRKKGREKEEEEGVSEKENFKLVYGIRYFKTLLFFAKESLLVESFDDLKDKSSE